MVKKKKNKSQWLTVNDACFASGIKKNSLRSFVYTGKIKSKRDSKGALFVSLPSVIEARDGFNERRVVSRTKANRGTVNEETQSDYKVYPVSVDSKKLRFAQAVIKSSGKNTPVTTLLADLFEKHAYGFYSNKGSKTNRKDIDFLSRKPDIAQDTGAQFINVRIRFEQAQAVDAYLKLKKSKMSVPIILKNLFDLVLFKQFEKNYLAVMSLKT
jgi:hypothetical protein